jgi:hypothetical protein
MNVFGKLATTVALTLASGMVSAQQIEPGGIKAGLETRMNRHQFFGSHNAWQDDLTLTEQLDGYNVWVVELDVRRINGGWEVLHSCIDGEGQAPFNSYIAELAQTQRAEDGLFFLNLEIGAIGSCDDWEDEMDDLMDTGLTVNQVIFLWMEEIREYLIFWFGIDALYTRDEFDFVDGHKWPSAQELLRRGRHVIPMASYQDNSAPWVFHRLDFVEDFGDSEQTFWNSNDHEEDIPNLNDRHMARFWESANCFGESSSDWIAGVNNGFSIVDTNCVEEYLGDYAGVASKFHPPVPQYALASATPHPFSTSLGTSLKPWLGAEELLDAFQKIDDYNALAPASNEPGHTSRTTSIPIELIGAGPWELTDLVPGTLIIDSNVVLQAIPGAPTVLK